MYFHEKMIPKKDWICLMSGRFMKVKNIRKNKDSYSAELKLK
jgi:hypothetical protein